MKAAVLREFGADLSIEDVDLAEPGPGQLRIRIAACAICHSDIAYADGAWGGTLPMVLGHEASGYVEGLGPGVHGLSVGQAVLVTLIRSCGTCPSCAAEIPTSCDHAWAQGDTPLSSRGTPIRQGMSTGAFAEAVVVDQSQIVPLPDAMDMSVAALLSCGVITGFGAVTNTARLAPGQSAVVIGAGGVGLNTIQGAAIAGADPIIAVDIAPAKLEVARRFGATHAVAAGQQNLDCEVRMLTGGRGADHVFVTVGNPAVFQGAPALLAAGGSMTMVGMPPSGALVSYDPGNIAAMNQRFLGSRMGQTHPQRDIPALLKLYAERRLRLDELVTARYPFAKINEAMAHTRQGAALRNVLVFGSV